MALTDFVVGASNRIVLGKTSAVGLIVTLLATLGGPLPAHKVQDKDGDTTLEISTRGAIAVGTGSGRWGNAGDCLKSGGSSGNLMSWGGCATAGGSVNTGAILDAANGRFVNVSGDTMTGSLHILNGKNLQVAGSITGSTVRAVSGLYSSGALSVDADGMFAAGNTTTVTVRRETTGQFASYTLNSAGTDIASFQLRNDSTNDVYLRDVANGRTWLKLVTNGIVKAPAGLSGATLRSDGVMTVSGALVLESSLTGATLFGFGLPAGGCSNGTTSKLLWNAATGMLSCGTDTDTNTQWSGTGALQNFFDNRYVNTSGDTMTGKLLINLSSGTDALEVVQTASASTLHANVLLRSSGSLVTESGAYIAGTSLVVISASNQVGMGTAQPAADLHITDDDSRTEIILDNTAANGDPIINFRLPGTAQWVIGLDDSNGDAFVISAGSSLGSSDRFAITQAGLVGIGTTSPDTALEVIGTASGAVVYAKDSLRSSGSLVWEGAGSGATLTVSGQLDGAGLVDCDTAGTSKLLWDATTKRFSCGTDQNTGGAGSAWSNTGSLQGYFDNRFVNTSGDSMTGALAINVTGGNVNTLGLRVINTFSGAIVQATKQLRSSGSIVGEGGIVLNGNGFVYDAVLGTAAFGANPTSAGLTIGNGDLDVTGGGLLVSGGPVQFYGGNVTIGSSAAASVALEVIGTASGTDVFAASSVTGSHLYAVTTLAGAGLADCDTASTSKLLWDASSKRFSCGTDQNTTAWSNTGSLRAGFDARYVNTSGDTMTGALTISVTGGNNATLGLKVLNQLSGSYLHAEKSLSTSGSLVWEGSASGAIMVVSGQFSGVGLTDCDLATQTLAWDASTNRFSCGTDSDTTYTAGQGLNKNAANAFALSAAHSGTVIQATTTLASSGNLVVEGTTSGSFANFTEVSPRWFQVQLIGSGTALTTGSGVGAVHIQVPISMSGWNVISPQCSVDKAGVTNTTTFQLRDREKKRKILSTEVSIDSTESGSVTAATGPTVNTSNDDVGGGDHLYWDIPTKSTTAPKGANCMFGLRKP